ncbi:hypothetical protein E4K10_03040 [Streptomyces sp. T1317-0309]|nr:hypothetical protein E4K10_03040 [Streptomyces sp. T1317-0309]
MNDPPTTSMLRGQPTGHRERLIRTTRGVRFPLATRPREHYRLTRTACGDRRPRPEETPCTAPLTSSAM